MSDSLRHGAVDDSVIGDDAITEDDPVIGLDHVQVVVPRAEEARARWFYVEVLGLREIPKPEALRARGGAWFRAGGGSIHIGLVDDFQPAQRAHPALLVRDLAAMRRRLEDAGLPIGDDVPIPGYRRLETRDPFGNRIELMERLGLTAGDAGDAPAGSATSAGEVIKSRVRDQFGRTAEAYVRSQGHAAGEDLARLVALAEPHAADRALDVATGGGHTALALAPLVARVVATDLTPRMLSAARTFLAVRGIVNADFVLADAERLPFLDEAFNLVTVRIAPHHFADVRAACREMARVLRLGGRLVLIDNVAPEDLALDAFVNDLERRRDPSHVRCYTPTEWVDLIRGAGLRVTHTETMRKAHDWAEWTARSEMPADAREALERDVLAAPAAAKRECLIVEEDGHVRSWSSAALILAADKPQPGHGEPGLGEPMR
jgi:ubiquinone/menaquinone biosynthesis C-methylase UbiE